MAKFDTKTLRSEVISSDVARHLRINFHLYSRCCLHTSAHLAFNFGLKGSMCAIYWLISMFSHLCLHTSAPLLFCYVLKQVVWMGLLLIAAGICFGFILLVNQEMLYWQANQKRWHLRVVDIPDWPYSTLYCCCWLVSFNRLDMCSKYLFPRPDSSDAHPLYIYRRAP